MYFPHPNAGVVTNHLRYYILWLQGEPGESPGCVMTGAPYDTISFPPRPLTCLWLLPPPSDALGRLTGSNHVIPQTSFSLAVNFP